MRSAWEVGRAADVAILLAETSVVSRTVWLFCAWLIRTGALTAAQGLRLKLMWGKPAERRENTGAHGQPPFVPPQLMRGGPPGMAMPMYPGEPSTLPNQRILRGRSTPILSLEPQYAQAAPSQLRDLLLCVCS